MPTFHTKHEGEKLINSANREDEDQVISPSLEVFIPKIISVEIMF